MRADWLWIGDLHFPYHHQDTFDFLKRIKKHYNPKNVGSVGDEVDGHQISFHQSSTMLPSASEEHSLAYQNIQDLIKIFPKLTIIESNHGSLAFRKAHAHGLPDQILKSYNQMWGAPKSWKWHFDFTFKLSNGNHCYVHHGKTTQVSKLSQSMGMSAIQGHYHEKMGVQYWSNPNGMHFAAQTGCLIDDKSYAFSYNNSNLKRPLLGSLIVIGAQAITIPMITNKKGRWIGRLI